MDIITAALYRLSQIDEQKNWITPAPKMFAQQGPFASANASVNLTSPPAGYVWLIYNLLIIATPDATQNYKSSNVFIADDAGNVLSYIDDDAVALATGVQFSRRLLWSSPLMMTEKQYIGANASFNAGVANNTLKLWGLGLQIPRGNIGTF